MSQPPSLVEFDRAIKRIPLGKSPGPDNIPYKLSQRGGLPLKSRLFSLILRMWESEKVPKDLKDVIVISIFKNRTLWKLARRFSSLCPDLLEQAVSDSRVNAPRVKVFPSNSPWYH